MSIEIKTTTKIGEVANFISLSILKQLQLGKKVLLLVTGGSSVPVGAKVAEILNSSNYSCENLTVTLTDERYVYNADRNWWQLIDKGFNIKGAKLIPIIDSDFDFETTVKEFNEVLEQEFKTAEYKIGLFGIGLDGHTAGILPGSIAVLSEDLAVGYYNSPSFPRITITPKTIEKLDEAVVFMQGKEKWPVLESLEKYNLNISEQPAQVLKKVPLLTMFTDKPI